MSKFEYVISLCKNSFELETNILIFNFIFNIIINFILIILNIVFYINYYVEYNDKEIIIFWITFTIYSLFFLVNAIIMFFSLVFDLKNYKNRVLFIYIVEIIIGVIFFGLNIMILAVSPNYWLFVLLLVIYIIINFISDVCFYNYYYSLIY